MNSRQRKTLEKLFAVPVAATIAWAEVESLLISIGCTLVEGAGSRVSFVFKGHVESFHRLHPQKEAKRYQVRQARDFLRKIGITP